MPLPNSLRSLSNRRLPPSESDQQLDPTRGEVSFTGMGIDMKAFEYAEVQTSYDYYSSSFEQDNESYIIPKALEDSFRAGDVRMMVWDLNDAIFTHWSGKYCVWYPPADGKFYLTKLRNDGVGYVDVPEVEEAGLKFWFLPEMAEIRKKLVATYGPRGLGSI